MKRIDYDTKKAIGFVLAMGAIGFALSLTACGTMGEQGIQGVPGPQASVTPETQTQQVVDVVNEARVVQGLAPFTQGLSCTVQQVGSGQWLSNTSPGYNAGQGVVTVLAGSKSYSFLLTGSFNQPNVGSGVNGLLPVALQPLFVGNDYKISCNGQIVVVTPGYYSFDMNSDDGSILTIDGVQVINNDGNHSMTDSAGVDLLTQGVHTFSLLYAQSGGGNFGLVLQANSSVIPGTSFYH